MDISIIVVNWNTAQITSDCLESVYQQTDGIDFEVIVIDNASSDDSVAVIKENFPQVVLVENNDNHGFAAANNQGMAIAQGRYVLLLNSDTIILANAIDKTISFADDHPESGVVGCRVLNPDKTLQPTCFMFPSLLNMLLSTSYLYKLFPKSRFFGRERMSWWNREEEREVDVVTGCFMLVRREAIEQVGLMDEQFFMYGEETDLCYRFKKTGWKVFFTPDAEIIHLGGGSSRQMKPEMTLQLRGSILLFIRKHKGRLAYVLACLLVALFFLLRVPYWLVLAIFLRSDRKGCMERAKTYCVGALRCLAGGKGLLFRKENGLKSARGNHLE